MGTEAPSREASCGALSQNQPWGDRCRQHLLFHGGGGDLKEKEDGEKLCRRPPRAAPIPPPCLNPKLSVSTKPERERSGGGVKDGGGKSKKIAKVNGLELEAAPATAV